ncbi:hypothetical protein HY947_00085 [Candidatus Gottesmanbacteria bacterium]|nr:hypothetical protein [Candidatus Gottesmanbacteria bacterium]
METYELVKQFQEGKAAADAQKAAVETSQAGLKPKVELTNIPVPPEFKEKTPKQVVTDVQGQTFREAAFAIGKSSWDDAGYNDIGYRTQYGVRPAVGLSAVSVEQDTNYSWETEEADRIRKSLSSEGMKTFYDEKPEYRKEQEEKLARYEAKIPKYKTVEEWRSEKKDGIVAKPREEFTQLVDFARSQLTEDQKTAYFGEMSEAVKNIAARATVEGALGHTHQRYASLEQAEVAVASELLRGFGGMERMMFEKHKTMDHEPIGGVEGEKLRESLLKQLSERYAAYQYIAKSVFGKEVMMPITDLQELASIRRDRPSFFERDTDVTGGRIGALAELRWPEGVSNLLEAMRRISVAERAVYAHRLLQAQPDLKLPKGVLTEKMGGGYGQYRIMTDIFEAIQNGNTPDDERLTLSETQEAVKEQAAAVNFVVAKEAKK